ncbi:MAG TPA: polyprenyl diphosphate synthase [Candidatus Acidoferrales bacterium]|nr:polyprenyl diphosphate synthase [Candidatus Acidoferrales bacterium]
MNLNGLDRSRLPRHVAIIMDGNGRWARSRGKSRIAGHRRGTSSVRAVVETSRKLGIPFLTLYAFSSENWLRPEEEVRALMGLLRTYLVSERPKMMRYGIRLLSIGDRERLPPPVRRVLEQTIKLTRHNQRMTVILALSYSGRGDIVKAARALAQKVRDGVWRAEDIDDAAVAAHTETAGLPDPDLLIRTSGEMRISNFFLWQLPYTELYFTPTLWPDFRADEYISALREFQRRRRRFGLTDEQIGQSRALASLR